jgi:hypothetical protein
MIRPSCLWIRNPAARLADKKSKLRDSVSRDFKAVSGDGKKLREHGCATANDKSRCEPLFLSFAFA